MAVIVLKHKIQALWFIMIRALLPFPEKLHNLVLLCSEHLSGVPSDCKAFFIFIFLTPQDKLGGKLCLTFQGNSGVSGIILGHCAYKSDYEVSPCKVFSFLHACSSDQPENITQPYLFTFVYSVWYRHTADYQQMLVFTELENEWPPYWLSQ